MQADARTRWPALAPTLAITAGCSAGPVPLEAPLAATPPMVVTGALGFNVERCESPGRAAPRGLAAGEPVAVAIGPLEGVIHAPHRAISSRKLASDKVRADFEPYLRLLRLTGVVIKQIDHVAEAIESILVLPVSQTETTVFSFRATVEDRMVFASCVATNEATTFGVFDDPRFRLACRLLSVADYTRWTFEIDGYGSWADYRFRGAIERGAEVEPLVISSHSVAIGGLGAINGFDIRSRGGEQLAALSFWAVEDRRGIRAGDQGPYRPLAWALPSETGARGDLLLAVLGLAHGYPWPTGCDARWLANESLERASEEHERQRRGPGR